MCLQWSSCSGPRCVWLIWVKWLRTWCCTAQKSSPSSHSLTPTGLFLFYFLIWFMFIFPQLRFKLSGITVTQALAIWAVRPFWILLLVLLLDFPGASRPHLPSSHLCLCVCSTGSSLMPQKKNADSLELIRSKAGRVFGRVRLKITDTLYGKSSVFLFIDGAPSVIWSIITTNMRKHLFKCILLLSIVTWLQGCCIRRWIYCRLFFHSLSLLCGIRLSYRSNPGSPQYKH